MTTIIHREARQSEHPVLPNKRPGRPPKLDARAQRAIIRHVEKFPHNNLHALSTPFKSGHNICRTTIRKYLKASGYFRYKTRRKLFLSSIHKAARLKWAKEHLQWTLDDWSHVNEATFETGLDTRPCYVTCRKVSVSLWWCDTKHFHFMK